MTRPMTDRQHRVVTALTEHGPQTVNEISRRLGWVYSTVYSALCQLEKRESVIRVTDGDHASLWWANGGAR